MLRSSLARGKLNVVLHDLLFAHNYAAGHCISFAAKESQRVISKMSGGLLCSFVNKIKLLAASKKIVRERIAIRILLI
jgi:hypothetical protein